MSGLALTLVLCAALLHALWNAIVKGAKDRGLALAAVSGVHVIVGLAMLSVSPQPNAESWPYILASTLTHYGYYTFLHYSYRFGDFSQVYPIARGIAPVLVALGAQIFAAEFLPVGAWIGLITVSLGIGVLSLSGGGLRADGRAIRAALATGSMIACYSVFDGIGVRLSENPFGYMGWLFFLEFPVAAWVVYHRRGSLTRESMGSVRVGLFGGLMAASAYGLVIYAILIAPLGAVSAVRESSVVFAAVIGVIWFGDRPWTIRVVSAAMVGGGVIAVAYFS